MKLYVAFLAFFVIFLALNILFLDNLRKVWTSGYPLILLAINLDLLILLIVFALFFRRFIKNYLAGRKGKLRRKLSNALFFYLIIPIVFLNLATAVILIQSTKTMITSPLKDIYVKSQLLNERIENLEKSKLENYREFFKLLASSGVDLKSYEGVLKDIKSIQEVDVCNEGETKTERIICVENYEIRVLKDEDSRMLLSSVRTTAKQLRDMVKSRDVITGIHVYFMVLITLIALLASVWFANLVARHVSLPIEKLSLKAKEIAKGNFDVNIDLPPTDDEIGILRDAFVKMKESLKQLYDNLKKEKLILQGLIESLPVGIAYFPEDENPIVNTAFHKLTDVDDTKDLEDRIRSRPNLSFEKIQLGNGVAYVVYDVEPYILAERFKTWQYAVKRIAHEIKNPLTPIALNLERIAYLVEKDRIDKEKVKEATEIMLKEVERIRRLVNQFRSLSAESGFRFEWVDLRDILEELKKLYSTVEINVEGNKRVRGDVNMLKDMFMNLFNNSIEWGAKRIDIKISKSELLYKDNGKGIQEGMEEVIFLPFQSDNPQGFGLGLSIVKHTANMHGWSLKALPSSEGFYLILQFS